MLQAVQIVFTDGADTASETHATAEAARAQITANAPELKVYAIGLGSEVDEEALRVLSEDRYYLASDATQLEAAFAAISEDLAAVYRYRVLVVNRDDGATADFSLTYGGVTLQTTFTLSGVE